MTTNRLAAPRTPPTVEVLGVAVAANVPIVVWGAPGTGVDAA